MKICGNCKRQYTDDALVCPYCGVPVNAFVNTKNIQPIVQQQPKKEKIGCITVFLWIFFFPIMAIIAIITSKKMKKSIKVGLVVLICIVCIAISSGNESEVQNLESQETAETENTADVNKKASNEDQAVIKEIGKFDTTEFTYEVGESFRLSLKMRPSDVEIDDIIVDNDNGSVIKIEDINVTSGWSKSELTFNAVAIGAGAANIIVKSADGTITSNTVIVTVEEPSKVHGIGKFTRSSFAQEVGDSVEFTVNLAPSGLLREDIVIENENDSVLQIKETSFEDDGDYTVFKFTATAIGVGESSLKLVSADAKVESNTISFSIVEKDTSRTVYTTPYGEKYHFSSACAGKNATETTLNKATRRGFGHCGKCAN